jgi:hypothetical protein
MNTEVGDDRRLRPVSLHDGLRMCMTNYRYQLTRTPRPEPEFVNVYGVQETIPPASVASRDVTSNRVVVPINQLGIDSWDPKKVYKYGL